MRSHPYVARPFPASLGRLLACLWLASVPITASDIDERAHAVARAQLEGQKLVGLAVGLIVDGEIAHLGGYGFSDREAEVEVDPRKTMFRWASISKPLTAIAAVQLAEQERLDLDKPIRHYVPEFPEKGAPISTRQLLAHLGGIVHYTNGKVIQTERDYVEEHPFANVFLALDKFKESPLVNAPGETFSYSTHGYILASAVVQAAGGKPFHEQVDERIAEPLGMKTLQPDYQWVDIPDRAVGYRKPKKRSGDSDVSWKLGGGGFISTLEDLTLFAKGLIDRKLVGEESYRTMWTMQTATDGKLTNYGLGFGIGGEGLDWQVSHSGSQQKTRTLMVIFPRQKSALTLMTNSEYADLREVAGALAPLLAKPAAQEAGTR